MNIQNVTEEKKLRALTVPERMLNTEEVLKKDQPEKSVWENVVTKIKDIVNK